MNAKSYSFIENGDGAISIIFNEPISEKLSRKIIYLAHQLKTHFAQSITDTIPAYQSLTICFNPLSDLKESLKETTLNILKQYKPQQDLQSSSIEIPVCYEKSYAPDIEKVAKRCQLKVTEVIEIHSKQTYLVHMLGFSPGFLYLGGLSEKIYCERKKTPSTRVPAGSIGIGGSQTGVYPQATPGGWQIIGRTPLNLFKPNSESPFIAEPLTKIRFVPITAKAFKKLANAEKADL